MGVRYYDEALIDKITKWLQVKDPKSGDTRMINNVRILKPDETTRYYEMTLDELKDAPLTLPLISVSREKTIEILNPEKHSKTFDGFTISNKYNLDENGQPIVQKKMALLNAIPIQLGYQIDIYTRKMEEADEYLRNFIFNFINYPKLVINVPYNDMNVRHESIIHLESSINDNSDIREHLFADQFVRFTLKIIIDDAYLFGAPVTDVKKIEPIQLEIRDRDNKSSITEDITN